MEFKETLNESFKRYRLRYKGTRPSYKIHDPAPYVLSIDDNYNVDGKGKSILGINLNYIKDRNIKKLLDDINKADNESGFRAFDIKMKIKKKVIKDKSKLERIKATEISERRKRYKNLIEEFPFLGKFVRRYKIVGITSKKRTFLK